MTKESIKKMCECHSVAMEVVKETKNVAEFKEKLIDTMNSKGIDTSSVSISSFTDDTGKHCTHVMVQDNKK